jgi:hypothetical protein
MALAVSRLPGRDVLGPPVGLVGAERDCVTGTGRIRGTGAATLSRAARGTA